MINSHLLYQLSYRGTSFAVAFEAEPITYQYSLKMF